MCRRACRRLSGKLFRPDKAMASKRRAIPPIVRAENPGQYVPIMNLVLKTQCEAPCNAEKDFSVVISCDEPTPPKIFEVLQQVKKDLKHEEGRLFYQWWNIEALAFAELRERGAVEAAQADMIVIGVRAGQELPGMVAVWMKRSLDLRRQRPGALVAVLDAGLKKSDAAPGTLSPLKAAAESGHLDFFAVGAKVGRDADAMRSIGEFARQFVMVRKIAVPDVLPGGWKVPVGVSGNIKPISLNINYECSR